MRSGDVRPIVGSVAVLGLTVAAWAHGQTPKAPAGEDVRQNRETPPVAEQPAGERTAADQPVGSAEPEELRTRSGYESVPQIGGPTSTGVTLIRSDLEKAPAVSLPGWSDRLSGRWFTYKERLYEDRGIAFGFSYNVMAQSYGASQTSSAVGGIFDAALSWTLVGHDTKRSGTLVLLAEQQHALGTRYAPEEAGLRAGSAVPTASFADFGWHLNNLYWSQQLAGESLVLVAGVVDVSDYVDYHSLNDPLTTFSNYSFAGTPTIPVPVPGAGVMLRAATDGFYVSGGVADGKAEPGSVDIDGLLSDPAPFTHLEIGVTPSFQQRLVENTHLTLWHQAADRDSGIAEDWGGALSLSTRLTERARGFLRGAVSRGRTTLLKQSVSLGGAYSLRSFDLVGLGINWGKPSISDREQLTFETFYRFQFGPVSTLTPNMQFVLNPGLDPERSSLVVLGLRLRIAL